MRYLKSVCGLVCFLILASSIWSMSNWNEAGGIEDEICYLRQAHLFQRFGLAGLDTDLALDDDHYLASRWKEMKAPGWSLERIPCHILMPSKKLVIQYPPGTGFVMALFPEGHQVIALYVLASIAIFGFGLLAIVLATTTLSILLTAAFADFAVYMMINPTKASYSLAPTVVVCALLGFLTARLFLKTPPHHRIFMTMLVGFLVGLAVNFRLANLFLSAGYFLFFGVAFLRSRKPETFLQGGLFGLAFLVGMAPTLIANAINAGSPLKTTYGGKDLKPPEFDVSILLAYATDFQFVLLLLASAWVALVLYRYRGGGIRSIALLTAGNLVVNLAYFMSHPVFTVYYAIPIAMLSLWTLLFASLMQPTEAADNGRGPCGQAHSAGSAA
ncbi:MAG: hypothetical protein E7813_15700 [Bradyrhizobium sp.]|uniref:hypothetical protein n=1 Tax=Bradyrhizobium sp. TaxID=376 RepID=UPI0012057276|nr:hypothetical protein [Bradyrhizobium sp.]THD65175.1 MAG: hypothetical protein E7813_15700 [Bradyrhizobium sp.]